ncbi:MAG TPA: sigma factor [Pirellulales bacterium]|jgi:RNA polymerase sigma-70 factor (ECF subfamily)|nr:sigma factor [Pirellulales bacterium]
MSGVSHWHHVYNEYARTVIRVKARQLVRRPGFSRSDREDIEQELAAHLILQAEKFDAGRASLSTFIARVIDSAVAMLLRERGRLKRTPADGVEIQSLEVMIEQPGEPATKLGATISSADLERRTGGASKSDRQIFEDAQAFDSALDSLPSDLREVCRRMMGGSEQDLSRRKVKAAMGAIRKRFERAGFGEK